MDGECGRAQNKVCGPDGGTADTICAGVEQAVAQGGRMPLHISMQGDENGSLPSHFTMASLPVV